MGANANVTVGSAHAGFEPVAATSARALRGASGGAVAIYHRGELVLDAWTGHRDRSSGEPWVEDTTAMVWSATKGVTSAALLLLLQDGALGLDDPVARHWPEFAANDKEHVLVRHVLAQEAGLHDVRHLVADAGVLLDHGAVATALAGARPSYPAGTASSYHALTYGYLVDELVRRVTGRPIGDLVRSRLTQPLGLDALSIGADTSAQAHMAVPPAQRPVGARARRAAQAVNLVTRLPPARIDLQTAAAAFVPQSGELIGSPAFVASANASVGAVATARSLARFYAALLGPVDGTDLWSDETRAGAGVPHHPRRRDLVLSIRPRWTLGYHVPWPRRVLGPGTFGFAGMYGSGGWADPSRDLAVAVVCPDAVGLPLVAVGRAAARAADARSAA